jgi:hypothetical protein
VIQFEGSGKSVDCYYQCSFRIFFGVSKMKRWNCSNYGHIEFAVQTFWIISMCNMPKNPQRKPNPKAAELSGKIQVKRRSIVFFHRVS